ncbi:MAG: endo-1,4-beta-xylanase [Candidatus Latescibacterota bacterium]
MKPSHILRHLLLLLSPLCLFVPPTMAGEDAYHAWLRGQLSDDYALTGGSWVLGDNEAGKTARLPVTSGVRTQTLTVADQPFSLASRLITDDRGNPWDRNVRCYTEMPIAKGDVLLLVVWIRSLAAERGHGQVEYIFEEIESPYSKSLLKSILPSESWQQWLVPFEAERDYAQGEARFQVNMGSQAQTIELGGLALLNYGKSYALESLPVSIFDWDYEGRDPDAPWRREAEGRIERLRKADMLVRVVDAKGQPAQGAEVTVRMLRHAFGFGTAVAASGVLGSSTDDAVYRNKLADVTGRGRTFSTAVLENALKWPTWENPDWPGTKEQVVGVVSWLKDRGMTVRGHNLVWPKWEHLPADVSESRTHTAVLRQRIAAHLLEEAGHPGLKGEILEWDVINEPVHCPDLAQVFAGEEGSATGEEIYGEWFHLAAQADPNAGLFVNEYRILSHAGMDLDAQERLKNLIQIIEGNGGRVDGIGMQAHMGVPLTPPERIYDLLDSFSVSGKKLAITEYDACGVAEDLAADYMRDFLTVVFSHPSVTGFLMWGFWDGAHWDADAPLFRQDWTLKPSGKAFLDLVFDDWWTDAVGQTDEQGALSVRGFLGEYQITGRSGTQSAEGTTTLTHDGAEIGLMLKERSLSPRSLDKPRSPLNTEGH